MKQFLIIALCLFSYIGNAQSSDELIKHYKAYYQQMKAQGDVQGIINGLTHINLLEPSQATQDTLAYIYMSEGKFLQALNTIGIDHKPTDSDIAVEVKAVSLKSLNQIEAAIVHFEEMFKRVNRPEVAYELAELNLQLNKMAEAKKHIDFGIANSKEDMKQAYYEMQQPYQVPLKAAFMYLSALHKFNENKTENISAAVMIFNQALVLAPNFNLAQISKDALLKQQQKATPKN